MLDWYKSVMHHSVKSLTLTPVAISKLPVFICLCVCVCVRIFQPFSWLVPGKHRHKKQNSLTEQFNQTISLVLFLIILSLLYFIICISGKKLFINMKGCRIKNRYNSYTKRYFIDSGIINPQITLCWMVSHAHFVDC